MPLPGKLLPLHLRNSVNGQVFPADITGSFCYSTNAEDARRTLAGELQASLRSIEQRSAYALESQGLSMGKLEEDSARLRELEFPLAELSPQAAGRLVSTIDSGFGKFIPDA